MRVCFYFGGFAPVGGIETSARNLLVELRSRGFTTSLVCWGRASPLLSELSAHQISVTRSAFRWGCRFNLPDWLMLPLGLIGLISSDVILFGKMLPNGIMKIVRLFNPNAKMIFITPYKPVLPSVPRELAKLAQSFDIFDEIWVQAPDFADDLHSLGVNRSIVVLPYMTQTLPSPTDLPMGSFKIGFLGRLVEDKNVNLLLRSFQIVADQLPSIGGSDDVGQSELHIFGDGPLRSQLQQEAVELGVGAQVFFHGALPQREVQNAVASCHLFVFTSRVEGQCLAALEILAGGRPIVATAVGAFPEILSRSDFGGLVNKALPDPIAAEISKLARRLSSEELTIEQVHKTYQELFGPVKLGSRYESTLLKFRVHQ